MTTRAVATDRLGVSRVGPETERSCQVGPEDKVLARTCSLRAGTLAADRLETESPSLTAAAARRGWRE